MNIKAGSLFGGVADKSQLGGQNTGRKTIFAGDILGFGRAKGAGVDRVTQIREQARKKASKILSDVFDAEKGLDQQIADMKEQSQKYVDIRRASIQELKKVEENRQALAEQYGVDTDSDEYRDLELLRRERDAVPGTESALTAEEERELERIHKEGITRYQKEMLEQDDVANYHQEQLDRAEKGISSINSSLRSIQIERLKSDPMLEAQSQAEEVLQQASKEILGEMRKEGMNHIEEKLQEVVEKAKEEAEKKEEQEEKLEKIKEKKEDMEQQIEAVRDKTEQKGESVPEPELDELDLDVMSSYNDTRKHANKELERLIENLEMIMDDLKGAEVDINL